jgi:hypothetical protein
MARAGLSPACSRFFIYRAFRAIIRVAFRLQLLSSEQNSFSKPLDANQMRTEFCIQSGQGNNNAEQEGKIMEDGAGECKPER